MRRGQWLLGRMGSGGGVRQLEGHLLTGLGVAEHLGPSALAWWRGRGCVCCRNDPMVGETAGQGCRRMCHLPHPGADGLKPRDFFWQKLPFSDGLWPRPVHS